MEALDQFSVCAEKHNLSGPPSRPALVFIGVSALLVSEAKLIENDKIIE